MPNFAVLDHDNKVINIIIADELATAEEVTRRTCVEYSDESPAWIGGTYDPGTGLFSYPVLPAE